MKEINRILYYTHNSIGIGHIFRARAVITGIRRWRPDIDFLVLSGTVIPHILLREGIEVLKLPGVEKVVTDRAAVARASGPENVADREDAPFFKPRYLKKLDLHEVMKLRQKIIAAALQSYRPEVVMVEHYLGGLLGEMTAALQKNRNRPAGGRFLSVALSRGIMDKSGRMIAACGPQRPEELLGHFDSLYLFDDVPAAADDGCPQTPVLPRGVPVSFLGRITDKCRAELPCRSSVCNRFRLPDAPIVLFALSRHGDVARLCLSFLEALQRAGMTERYQTIFVIDPYLKQEALEEIQNHPLANPVRFLPFFHPLVDIMNAAELVICRAGYNTVNELLLTGVKAIVIPELHPSGEQETRIGSLPRDNIVVLDGEAVLREPPVHEIEEIMARPRTSLAFDFNKYDIGRRLITDLEGKFASRRGSS